MNNRMHFCLFFVALLLIPLPKAYCESSSEVVEKELVELIFVSNKINKDMLGSFDCQYSMTMKNTNENKDTVELTSKKGRFAFKSNKTYSMETIINSDDKQSLHFVQNGSKKMVATNSKPRLVGMQTDSKKERGVQPGSQDPWTVCGQAVLSKLWEENSHSKVLSTEEMQIEGKPYIKMKASIAVALPDGSFISSPTTLWFSVNERYMLKKYEYTMKGKPGLPGWDFEITGMGEVREMQKYDCNGSLLYLPTEFYAEDVFSASGIVKSRTYEIHPETVKINPDLPDELFVIKILPTDQVMNLDLAIELQGPTGRNLIADPIIEDSLDKMAKNIGKPSEPKSSSKKIVICKDIAISLVHIPAGEFVMGSPDTEIGYPKNLLDILKRKKTSKPTRDSAEGPPHKVRINNGFGMSKYEITCEQYRCFNPSFKNMPHRSFNIDLDGYPACVSWNNAMAFCEWLSNKTGLKVRLPSEEEWEYACRAGSRTRFYWGEKEEDAGKYANIADLACCEKWPGIAHCLNTDDKRAFLTKVGTYLPNDFGLFDMIGNVSEWCQDIYVENAYSLKKESELSQKLKANSERVHRGGKYSGDIPYIRCASRGHGLPNKSDSFSFVGFRILVER